MKHTDKPQKAARTKKKKKKRSWVSTVLMLVLLLIGAGVIAYPTFSDWWNSYHQSRAIANYASVVDEASEAEIEAMMEAARVYNASLLQKPNRFMMTTEDMGTYRSLLDISGTGLMGYIQIDSIGVDLPIYHTTEESVLQVAVGHIEWSSLPIGGESTHTVLSGHRGLPSARLFTDLDKLREGDTFTITVLRQTATYVIDQIRIVEPHEVSSLDIVSGQDYCTLVTCTPYGINTHRMLVRGHRMQVDEELAITVSPEAVRIPNYITIPAVGVPLLFISLILALVFSTRRKRELSEEDLLRKL